MARNGQRIFDADTHTGPSMDVLETYMSQADRDHLRQFDDHRRVNKRTGQVSYTMGARSYRRRLGDATTDEAGTGYMAGFVGAGKGQEPHPDVDRDSTARVSDLDLEGVDVNFMLPSGWFGTWTSFPEVDFEMSAYRAYHQWMKDYCTPYPDRLGGTMLVSARAVEESVREIERCANERWAWAVLPYAPAGMPLDHPDLDPIWAAAAEHDMAVVLHTFTVMPPYSPGGLDTWENLWLQRSAAHPWCGMRNMAALLGSGIMDRHPSLRIGVLEAGHGWLPFWVMRLDEHVHSMPSALPELKRLPSECVQSGRYFQSIELSEGQQLTEAVMDLLGDDILMFATDYPHSESWFPKSVDAAMEWTLSETRRQKLMWDNAVRLYTRAGLQ